MPAKLILLVGPPGVGKSTLARAIRSMVPTTVVQTDAIRKALVANPTYLPAESAWVHRVAQQRLSQALKRGKTVVFDATNLRETYRKPLYKVAEDAHADVVVLVVWAPEALIHERLDRRAANPGPNERSDANWAVYLHLRDTFEPVTRPHLVVNTTVSLNPAIGIIRRLIA